MVRRQLPAAVLAAAALLAACGGGGGEREAVEETIVAASTSDDPADCERLHTLRLLESMSGLEGEAAVGFCEELARDPRPENPRSVTVTRVRVDDSEATADAAFEGSSLDGQAITIALVEEDGRWKLDELVSFVRFDRERMLEAMTEEMADLAEDSGDPSLPACILGWIEAQPDQTLESIALAAPPEELDGVVEDCLRRSESDQSL